MPLKLRIKVGSTEVEYEGEESFLKEAVAEILDKVYEVYRASSSSEKPMEDTNGRSSIPDSTTSNGASKIELTTGNIAMKFHARTGADLALAACVHLHFVLNKPTFTRAEILEDMKTATSYFQETYRKNLTNILQRLVKGNKLVERRTNVYASHSGIVKELGDQVVV
jgi:hypothetical protein